LVNWLLNLVAEQQEMLENQRGTIAKLEEKVAQLEEKVGSLDEQLKVAKKLKGQPKIRPSTLNQTEKKSKPGGKRPGSDKRSQVDRLSCGRRTDYRARGIARGNTLQWVSRV